MSSFIEKLKKGMVVDKLAEEVIEEVSKKPVSKKKIKQEKKETPIINEIETEIEELYLAPIKNNEVKKSKKILIETIPVGINSEKRIESKKIFGTEGELAVDVYQTEINLIIKSAIAGVKPENLDIQLEEDLLIIKGNRAKNKEYGDYFCQECHWGPFSREIILPTEVDQSKIEAEMKEGILTIKIPKTLGDKKKKIIIS